jgi:hypothetical protein
VSGSVTRPSFKAAIAVPLNSAGNTNAQVTALLTLFDAQGQKLEAVDSALDVFATYTYPGGAVEQASGLAVNVLGVGVNSWNVASSADALGVPNGTTPDLFTKLLAADNSVGDSWDSAMVQRVLTDAVFDGTDPVADSD